MCHKITQPLSQTRGQCHQKLSQALAKAEVGPAQHQLVLNYPHYRCLDKQEQNRGTNNIFLDFGLRHRGCQNQIAIMSIVILGKSIYDKKK